ncbi:energy transducer TonB, partial [Methylogaea oryzae]|uniref:energy transducer TonB n=1 Tax=Methylogaea oryzae TaxID=1295382 RepID=UPI000B149226
GAGGGRPVAPFVEASYRASYLNNPAPKYPMLAKERHWEGLVVLKVQVLADGSSGGVSVEQSSGHDVLDEAAAEAARHWRFVPAKRGEDNVTSVVLVPIEFKLRS